jgi:hypothetical protein
MPKQTGLHMRDRKWLLEQGVVEKIYLSDGKVICSPPICVDLAQFIFGERFLH